MWDRLKLQPHVTFMVTPAHLSFQTKLSAFAGKGESNLDQRSGRERNRSGCRHSPFAHVHHFTGYLCLACYPDQRSGDYWAAEIAPIIADNYAQSSFQDASDLMLG